MKIGLSFLYCVKIIVNKFAQCEKYYLILLNQFKDTEMENQATYLVNPVQKVTVPAERPQSPASPFPWLVGLSHETIAKLVDLEHQYSDDNDCPRPSIKVHKQDRLIEIYLDCGDTVIISEELMQCLSNLFKTI